MRIVSAHALSKEGLPPLQPVDYRVVSVSTLSNFISIGRGSLSIGVGGLRVRGCCQRILNLLRSRLFQNESSNFSTVQ
jgi:hypothetical protein